MRGSRKKMINVTCSEGVRKKVDQFLSSEYQAWKEIHQPRRDSQGIFTCGSHTNNTLLMDYIRFIYNQYSIADPLSIEHKEHPRIQNPQRFEHQPDQINKRANINIRIQQSGVKEPNNANYFTFNKFDSPRPAKPKILEQTPVRKVSVDISDTIPKQGLFQSRDTTRHNRESSLNHERGTFGSIEKSDFLKSDNSSKFIHTGRQNSKDSLYFQQMQSAQLGGNQNLNLHPRYTDGIYTPKQNKTPQSKNQYFQFSNKIHQTVTQRKPVGSKIAQSYRYCIACEEAVLDANVQRHQISCADFAQIYKLDLEGIIKHLNAKIQSIRQKMKDRAVSLREEDHSQMKRMCDNMHAQSLQVLHSGRMSNKFISNYDSAIKIGRRWTQASEHINKLRWFLKIREQINKHFNL